MGKSRNNRRHGGDANYLLFSAETTLGWRVIKHVTGAQGEEMLARGAWRDVYDERNNHIGYQLIPNRQNDSEMLSRSSAASITVRECQLNAGLRGSSRTAGMTEDRRITRKTRYGVPLPPEDAIERAKAKVTEWGRSRLAARPRIADLSGAPSHWDQFPELAKAAALR